jgi:transcriptional regulator with XRE-family HTH domain
LAETQATTQELERHVGQRIRQRRIMLGLTQQQLAKLVGITYQQAHKYERGINRVSAGRLYHIANVLQVDVSYFYEDLNLSEAEGLNERERMCLDVARNFAKIYDMKKQEAIAQLTRILADKEG